MRYLVFIFLLALTPAVTWGAETPMLERTITISIKGERLDVALKRIAEQGGFSFSYNSSIIDVNRTVTISFSNTPIREVLDQLFEGSIDYKERRKYVILTKAKKNAAQVSGYITDSNGGRLGNVTVYDPVTLISTITDANGYFKIKIVKPDVDLKLVVNKSTYQDTVINVRQNRGFINLTLKKSQRRIRIVTDSVRVKWSRFWKRNILSTEEVNMANVDTLYRSFQVSVLPFVGTNHKLSGNVINDFSFNLYGGYALGVKKFEIGGIFNLERGDVQGGQFAGWFNGVNGKMRGVQMAGIFNANRDSTKGAQFAGMINFNWNSAGPVAIAGLLNITHHQSKGAILAGLGNVTVGDQEGVHAAGLFNVSTHHSGAAQLAGLYNFTLHRSRGFQAAGLFNFAGNDSEGGQAAGLLNVAGDSLRGVQLSALLNVANHVKGLQLGIVNVSNSINGVPVGLLSFSAKGYHQIEISSDEIFYTNIAFRTGVRQFYNILTAAIKPQNTKENYWSFGYGIGSAPRLSKRLSLNFDITSNQVSYGQFTQALNLVNKAFIGCDYRLFKYMSVAGGITLNAHMTDTNYSKYANLYTDYDPHIILDRTYEHSHMNMKMWWGAKVAVRFL